MSMRTLSRSLLLAALVLSGAAHAVSPDGYYGSYGTAAGIVELGQDNRNSKLGYGGALGFGLPIARQGESIEFTLKYVQRERDGGGPNNQQTTDDQKSLFVHWVREIGGRWIADAKPFVHIGAGALHEDVLNDSHFHPGVDGGLGALFPIGWRGWAIRAQGSALFQINNKSVPDEEFLIDFQLQLGLQLPFGSGAEVGSNKRPSHSARVVPAPEYPDEMVCANRIVDPVTGRGECITDSDGDSVADRNDQCPGTVAGTPVDSSGCSVKSIADSDGDGVLDEIDACPETVTGMKIDATGCLVEQTIVMRGIQFATGSAKLTGDSKIALDNVARTLYRQKNLEVEIVGHTDSQGNDNFNLVLSQERAESVRQYLIGRAVEARRLSALGFGESAPIADNGNESGRRLNRRVEFNVRVR